VCALNCSIQSCGSSTSFLFCVVFLLPPPFFLLGLVLSLYRPQSANLVDCDWLAASGSDCHLVQILTLHSSCLNDCD
jgi:hypothetical protein